MKRMDKVWIRMWWPRKGFGWGKRIPNFQWEIQLASKLDLFNPSTMKVWLRLLLPFNPHTDKVWIRTWLPRKGFRARESQWESFNERDSIRYKRTSLVSKQGSLLSTAKKSFEAFFFERKTSELNKRRSIQLDRYSWTEDVSGEHRLRLRFLSTLGDQFQVSSVSVRYLSRIL